MPLPPLTPCLLLSFAAGYAFALAAAFAMLSPYRYAVCFRHTPHDTLLAITLTRFRAMPGFSPYASQP